MPRGWLGARTRPWAKALGAGTLAALLLGAPLPAYGAEPAQARAVGTVTLVTGDRVSVSRQPDGTHLATLLPRDGGKPQGAVKVVERGEDVYVIPAEAQAHVVAGVLDRELFNVTGLLADGHGDGPTPLIVAYDEVPGARAAEQAPAHSTRTATLESIDAVAVEVPAGEAAAFWAGLRGSLDAGARQAAPGVKRVWLDPTLEADLAESVPQIGAPAAWKAGFDGAGTTVAVLDTGYDPAHPDLGGKVQGSADFTGSGVADRHGHGTHVAATVAGGGAASSGTHVGVAPGAGLLVGKVLGDDGSGQGSWLIEGMEWAVSQGADVVNMSLSTEATDGTDPLSQAVNELSARSGALFVAAAGNTGPDELTARSPGVADAALSVAAVDKSDVLADFSSRGPRLGDHAVKPDLAAPGVGIVAARAAGTGLGTPAGEAYTSVSGTSMAAPHVAGAAAILKQRHPDWTGERIKAALAGSAHEVPGTVYEVGAGRVDVARAVAQTVTASPASLSFGRHPHDSRDPVTQTITYRNDGGADVALSLAVTTDSPAGLFTLDRSTLTVPAGGTAEARLRLDPGLAESATYGGRVTATGDGAVVRTAFGARKDPRMVQVTVEGITQNGSPAAGGSSVDLWNLDTDAWLTGLFGGKGGPGPAVVSVPVGTYSVTSALWTLDDSGAYGRDVALVAEPEIELTEDTRLVLDARTGSPLNPITPDPTEARELTLGYHRAAGEHDFSVHYLMDRYVRHAYAVKTEPVGRGDFEVSAHWELYAPEFTMKLAGSTLEAEYAIDSPRIDGRHRYVLADAGRGTPEDVAGRDLRGRLALVRRSADVSVADQVSTVGEAGAAAVIIHHDRPGFLITQVASPIPAFTVEQAVGQELLARVGSRLEITGIPDSPYVYDLFPYYAGRVPAKIERRVEHRDLARTTAHYYGGTGRGAEVNFPHRPYDSYIIRQAQEVAIPSTRTEWTTAGDGVVWRPFTWRTAGQDGGLLGSPRSYRAGQKRTEEWFAPVMRPGVPEVLEDDDAQWGLPGFREGDAFTVMVRNMLDGGDHFSEREGEARARLYRDGEQVAERDALEGTWPAAAEPTRYRLELDVQHSEPWWEQATRTRTVWGFDSRRPAEGKREVLDLLQIDYDVPAGLDGAVPAGKPARLGLRIYPQTHPDALVNAAVKVWTSHDEGASWQQARKVKQAKDGSLDVTVTHPKGAKSVSLRVEAVARDGVSIDQTVIRAFGLS